MGQEEDPEVEEEAEVVDALFLTATGQHQIFAPNGKSFLMKRWDISQKYYRDGLFYYIYDPLSNKWEKSIFLEYHHGRENEEK